MATKKSDMKKPVDLAAKAEAIRRAEEALRSLGGEDDLPSTVKTKSTHKESTHEKAHETHHKTTDKKEHHPEKKDDKPKHEADVSAEKSVTSAAEVSESETKSVDASGAGWIAETENSLQKSDSADQTSEDETKPKTVSPDESPFAIGTSPVLPAADDSGTEENEGAPADSTTEADASTATDGAEKTTESASASSTSPLTSDSLSSPFGSEVTSPLFGSTSGESTAASVNNTDVPQQADTTVKTDDTTVKSPSEDVFAPFESESEKKGSKKMLLVAGFVVIGIIVGGIVYWFFGRDMMAPAPATPTITQAPTATPSPTPIPLDRSEWSLEVLNGSGVRGAAADAAATLEDLGYEDVDTGNAERDDYEANELHVSRDMEDKAPALIEDLKEEFGITEVSETYDESTPTARIILGGEQD